MTKIENFINQLRKQAPKLKVAFKDESIFMRWLGKILFFNPGFTTQFITTIGNTIYLPSRDWMSHQAEETIIEVVSHEYMHVRDYQKMGLIFALVYLFPISLLPFLLFLLFALPWYLVVGLMALCLAPLPAPGRMYFEFRGYTMSLFTVNELAKAVGFSSEQRTLHLTAMVTVFNEQFTSFNYYKMWPFGVKDQLLNKVDMIESGDILNTDVIYREVAEALALVNAKTAT